MADTTPFGLYNINDTEGWGEALCTQHCMAGEALYGILLAGVARIAGEAYAHMARELVIVASEGRQVTPQFALSMKIGG